MPESYSPGDPTGAVVDVLLRGPSLDDDLVGPLLGPVFLLLGVVLAAVVGLVGLLLELVLVVFLSAAALFTHGVLREPWRIEAVPNEEWQLERAWEVVGWRASRRAMRHVANALEAGERPEPPEARRVPSRYMEQTMEAS